MNRILLIPTFAILLISACSPNKDADTVGETNLRISRDEVYRGFDVGLSTSDAELDTILAITGGNLFRAMGPYVSKEPPYDFIESSFQHLDRVLNWAKKNNVRVCIDPHTTPGVRDRWTIYPNDEFWKDKSYWTHLVKAWVRIVNEHKHRGLEIYGYDLLNEPAIPDPAIHGNQWHELVGILVDTIRSLGDQHPIIVEPTWISFKGGHMDRVESLSELVLPDDDNLIVSPHVYEPFDFTHQGVNRKPAGIPYPGQIGDKFWDKNELSNYLQPIRDFQKRNNGIPIFIGEFSASRAGGDASNVYLKDLIDLFEAEGWSWAYHDLRGGRMWDPELPVGSNARGTRDKDTPRMQLLRSYYAKGTAPSELYQKW